VFAATRPIDFRKGADGLPARLPRVETVVDNESKA
jgi:hypothetical protein